MKLSDLIKNLDIVKVIGNLDIEVFDVVTDSRFGSSSGVFVCLNGQNHDGHVFVNQAIKNGCVAIISEKELPVSITQIIVSDTRIALSVIASNFYGNIDKKMNLIGVIGTNGKTSTAHLIGKILNGTGKKCGVIGTLGTFFSGVCLEQSLTTPDPLQLHKALKEMYDCGIRTAVMEISAHAIYFKKVYGIKFAVAVFTNFSRDHLDFFNSEENYREVKKSFFSDNECKYIVTNADDELGREISKEFDGVITYSIDNPSDVFAIEIKEDKKGISFIINLFDCVYNVDMKLSGRFNVYNALAGATACALIGVKTERVISGLRSFSCVDGRLEKVYSNGFNIYVDYAHTPDGLEKVLSALKSITSGNLFCVFGCGGNRDVGKRREMGKISGLLANFTVITSDNPRYEEPMDIIFEIEKGVLEVTKKYVIIQDRKQAIEYAIDNAKKGDTILIAGKGAEKYQEILGIKLPYNDKDMVSEILRSK